MTILNHFSLHTDYSSFVAYVNFTDNQTKHFTFCKFCILQSNN